MSNDLMPSSRRYVLGFPFWIWIVLAAGIAIALVQMLIGDQGMANGITWSILVIAASLCLGWLVLFSGYRRAIRWRFLGLAFLVVGALILAVRIDGFTGDIIPLWSWRWSPPPSEREPEQPGDEEQTTTFERVDLATTTPHDFPQFLGPRRDLNVTGVKLARDWTANPPREMWRQPIGAGWSGFAVVNGYAVTMEQRAYQELVTCYRVETGKLCWVHSARARYETWLGGIGPRSTPTIYQGQVYALGATGKFHCLDGATGESKWYKDMRAEFGLSREKEHELVLYGRSNSPLIIDEHVILPAGGPEPGRRWTLAAFHQDNGAVIWKRGDHNISYSSPVLAVLAGVPQILSVNEHFASGHDPKTGDQLWEVPWPGRTSEDANVSQPVPVPPDRVFLSKGYGVGAKLIKLVPKGDGTFDVETVYHRPKHMKTKFTNVTIRDGFVYGLSDGILECMELDTGQQRWREGRYGHGQILRVDDLLLVLSEQGELSLVEATPDEPNHVLGTVQAVEGRTWNNLAMYGPYLLVRNGQEAVCYRLATE
jgi:outer membrane protein assembly factor BamB